MTTLSDLSDNQLRNALSNNGVRFRVGPYVYSLESELPLIQDGLKTLYGDFPLASPTGFADYHVALRPSSIIQRVRGKLDFYLDDQRPFNSMEKEQAYAFLEWGMNWCVSVWVNEYLKLHSAVVSKDGIAMILPGLPGAGKSTLCAALALDGWRVLSDEHCMIPLGTSDVVPLYRPISLKNESIEIIKRHSPNVIMGPITEGTHKGAVAHMKADFESDSHDTAVIPARLMIFPQYISGSDTIIGERSRAECFMFAAHHSFNYSVLSAAGFDTMETLLDAVQCYDLRYSTLNEAIDAINNIHSRVTL